MMLLIAIDRSVPDGSSVHGQVETFSATALAATNESSCETDGNSARGQRCAKDSTRNSSEGAEDCVSAVLSGIDLVAVVLSLCGRTELATPLKSAGEAEQGSNEALRKQAEEALDIALDDPDANAAAAKIQAGFRGHMTRKKMKSGDKDVKHKEGKEGTSAQGEHEGD
ncbi:unnamed protein product [Ranitomeya imitator]|uniref:Neuromodulin n=1 Tax=Ranitomeya imitator TaxID=111125 RepID=A0ABN9MJX3_9NEOB|nr:unnamed protein product [Ranitomeya imitator]